MLDRLADKFTIGDGCWEWTAGINHGYGQFRVGNRMCRAHRIIYELLVGPIPEGLHLDHLCRNRKCVRPDHLEPVTAKENLRRGDRVGLRGADFQRSKTHCPRGHEYDGENLKVWGGKRYCRTCRIEGKRARKQRARELAGSCPKS